MVVKEREECSINTRLTRLYFFLRKNIINYKNINLVSLFNNGSIYNVLIIARDFNIRNNDCNPSYSYYFNHIDSLKEIADSFNLEL